MGSDEIENLAAVLSERNSFYFAVNNETPRGNAHLCGGSLPPSESKNARPIVERNLSY